MNPILMAVIFLPVVMAQATEPVRVATCSTGDPVCEQELVSFNVCPRYCGVRPSSQQSLLVIYTQSIMQTLSEAQYIQIHLSDGTLLIYEQVHEMQMQSLKDYTDIWLLYPWPVGGEGQYWKLHFTLLASFKP